MAFQSAVRSLVTALGFGLAGLASTSTADAAAISVFFNGSYTDRTEEGIRLTSNIENLGHTVTTFEGSTAADFSAGIGANTILIFPEMERGNLINDLSASARATLTNFVATGGTIIQANAFQGNANLPNTLLGTSLVQVGSIGATSLRVANTAGTAFAGGPAALPGSDAVEGVSLASLPGGASIYDDGTDSSVFLLLFGTGKFIYLGFDWFDSPPTDPAWSEVLDRAIAEAGVPTNVPEPASLALLGASILVLAVVRRRRTA